MRIVSFAQFAGSPYHGMVFGHYYLAREWVKKRHQVTLVSARFSHTRSCQPLCSKWKLWTIEEIDGIEYVWLATPNYRSESKVGRMFSIIIFTFLSMVYALTRFKVDTVIASSHHPLAFFPAKLLSIKSRCKLIFEVRDLWPLTLVIIGNVSSKNPVISFMYWVEKLAYRFSNYTVSVLPLALPYMKSKGLSANKFIYVPNGVTFFDEDAKDSPTNGGLVSETIVSFRKEYEYIIGYFGRIGEAQELFKLVDALASMQNLSVGLLIVGDGPLCSQLAHDVKRKKLSERVCMTGQVSKLEVSNIISLVDICYLGLIETPLFKFGVSPTKLNDYLAASKPVIYAVANIDESLEPCEAIYFCKPTAESIQSTLNLMLSIDKPQLEKIGTSGRKWARDNRSYSILAEQFLSGPSHLTL